MKKLGPTVAALLVPLILAACGTSEDSDDVASDPTPTTPTAAPSSPSSSPTVGTYPAYAPEDYTFHLSVSCFCMGAGVPIEVSVVDAVVVGAIYLTDDSGRSGVAKGDPADKAFWLTINDVIDAANDTSAARVDVDWPAGQDYPNSVYVDGSERIADDEVGYTVSAVTVG